jgi:ABC-type branched-subunit amino acid transport system permease subunit
MAHLGRWQGSLLGGLALAGIVVVLALATMWLGGPKDEQLFIVFAINLVLAVGVQSFMGTSGIVSFGHLAFAALGAFITGLLTTPVTIKQLSIPEAPSFIIDASLSFPAAAAVGVVLVSAFALVVGWPLMRLHGTEAAIATFALLVIVQVVLINAGDVTRGAQTFYGVPKETTVWTATAFAVVALVVARLVRDSNTGLSLRSTQMSSLAAESAGVNTVRVRLALWTVSAGIMALGGCLYAHYVTAFSPNNFSLALTFLILTMVILGGQTISGALLGAVVVTAITEILRRTVADIDVGPAHVEGALVTPIVLGIITIAILMARPLGMLGRMEGDAWLRRTRRARALRRESG